MKMIKELVFKGDTWECWLETIAGTRVAGSWKIPQAPVDGMRDKESILRYERAKDYLSDHKAMACIDWYAEHATPEQKELFKRLEKIAEVPARADPRVVKRGNEWMVTRDHYVDPLWVFVALWGMIRAGMKEGDLRRCVGAPRVRESVGPGKPKERTK